MNELQCSGIQVFVQLCIIETKKDELVRIQDVIILHYQFVILLLFLSDAFMCICLHVV